jgi:hypothetical protein
MRKPIPMLFPALLLATGMLAAGTAAIAADPAANPTPSAHAGRAALLQQHFDTLDADQDKKVSRDEYRAWVDRRFDKLDTNRDGSFDADEVAASPATSERAHKRAEGLAKRYDTSGTGKVTRADFEAAQMQRFERIGGGADSVGAEQLMQRHGARGGKSPSATPYDHD